MIIPMESIKTPKRIIKKQLKNVNKAIIEIAEMKFENIEEKEEKSVSYTHLRAHETPANLVSSKIKMKR